MYEPEHREIHSKNKSIVQNILTIPELHCSCVDPHNRYTRLGPVHPNFITAERGTMGLHPYPGDYQKLMVVPRGAVIFFSAVAPDKRSMF